MFNLYSTSQIPPKKAEERRKTSRRKVVKKKASILVDDNIIPEPDIALELGKYISLAEAEEEAAAREVHDTHARIVTESVPEPARTIRQSSIAFRDTSTEQEAADIMKALKDSKKMIGRQPGTGGSDEGTGEIPGVPDESIFADAEDDNEETESDSEILHLAFRILPDCSYPAGPCLNPASSGRSCINNKQHRTPTTIPTPPINIEAPAITTAIPEITPFIALQLRVAKLEQDMFEVKKIDHSAAKTLSCIAPESSKKQESEKSPEEIIRIKREQEEKKQEPTYTIKSTDKAALEEFDLKSALFKSMHKNKSANRNPANYRLYHALMEALIEDENAMDKEVADTVKDHKRKHDGDDDDDDDDEGPPAGSNQGKSSNKRRTREFESAKKPSTTKESSKDKDPNVGSKTGKSAPAKDPVEEPTDKVIMDEHLTEDIPISNEGDVSDLEDTNNAHMPKVTVKQTTMVPGPILKEENPASPELAWVINPPIDAKPEADNNWANAFSKAHQIPMKTSLHNKIDEYRLIHRWYMQKDWKRRLQESRSLKQSVATRKDLQVSIKTYARYDINNLREIVLRRADYNEYKISEKDFKSLHPNDFEDLNILHIQGKFDHLPKQDKVNLHNAVHIAIFSWSSTHCGNKTIFRVLRIILVILPEHLSEMKVFTMKMEILLDLPSYNALAVTLRFIHKFCDATLNRVLEGLKSYNNDVKYGYVQKDLTKEEAEYLKLFEEEIEEILKHRRQMRRWEMFVNGRPLGPQREHPE
ncbi:hypothetical protein Tco_0312669 [Tanacetum coccineum]